MKTSFPLFARLLLWFFINLLILMAGLLFVIRAQFGSLTNLLLPESSQNQIQAMSGAMLNNLVHLNRNDWTRELSGWSGAYRMSFALYGPDGDWIAGEKNTLPDEVRRATIFPHDNHPPPATAPRSPGILPPEGQDTSGPANGGPPDFNPRPGEPPPTDRPPLPRPGGKHPDFPKNVLWAGSPPVYWLLVRLPPEPFRSPGPITLVGMTPALGDSPLLFNPKPWLLVAAGVVVFSALFWLPLARNLTNSIVKMTRATESIAEGRFDIQLADSRRDELGRLGHAINRMAGRLNDYVTGQKRFLGDAAHELCTPLARMEIALGILEERGDEKSLSLVRDVRDEVTHMRKLANDLLNFSKASLGESHLKLESVSVAEVVQAAVSLEKNTGCEVKIGVAPGLNVWGNFDMLFRAVANLVRNAARYAGHAGPIAVAAWQERDDVFITVSDQGPGVANADLEKLFDPFYRVDSSRTSETGGVGLGLAIVKTCVEACRGVVSAANREPHGLEVQMRLKRFDGQ